MAKQRWLVSQDSYVFRAYKGAAPKRTRRGTWPRNRNWKWFTREELDFLLPPDVQLPTPGDDPVLLGKW